MLQHTIARLTRKSLLLDRPLSETFLPINMDQARMVISPDNIVLIEYSN